MVLHDVAQRTDLVVELATTFDTEVLEHVDGDRLDEVTVPQRFENRVGESEDQDVEHRLLAEEMIDPVDALLGVMGLHRLVELARALEVATEGLLQHDAAAIQPAGAQAIGDGREQERRDGQVADRTLGVGDLRCDLFERLGFSIVTRHVVETIGEPLPDVFVDLLPTLDERLVSVVAQFVERPVRRGDTDHRHPEDAVGLELVQRGEQLLLRQVTGDAEEHQGVGGTRKRLAGHQSPSRS